MKVYISQPELGGLYRAQANELIEYKDTYGYRSLNQSDWEALLNFCLSPSAGAQNIRKELKRLNYAQSRIEEDLL